MKKLAIIFLFIVVLTSNLVSATTWKICTDLKGKSYFPNSNKFIDDGFTGVYFTLKSLGSGDNASFTINNKPSLFVDFTEPFITLLVHDSTGYVTSIETWSFNLKENYVYLSINRVNGVIEKTGSYVGKCK